MENPLDRLLSHRLRGFSPHESSLSALRAALVSKARYLEIDTRVTADGEILVLHDTRLDRLTVESGPVYRWPFGRKGSPLFAGSPEETLARFEDFVATFAAAGTDQVLMVDIKDYGCEEKHHEILARHGVLDRVEIVSWLPEALLRWHEIDPRQPLSFSHVPLTGWPRLAGATCALLGSGALLRGLGRLGPAGSALFDLRDVFLRFDDENRLPVTPEEHARLVGTFPIHVLDRLPGGALGEALVATRGSVGIPASLATPRYVALAHAAGLRVFIFSLDTPEAVRDRLATAPPDIIFTNQVRLFDLDWAAGTPLATETETRR